MWNASGSTSALLRISERAGRGTFDHDMGGLWLISAARGSIATKATSSALT
jgi:hypothetical protein